MRILGVDPGINGAVAAWDGTTLAVEDTPTVKSKGRGNEINVAGLADLLDVYGACDHAFIELVQSRPMEGRGTAFKFGYACGVIRGIVVGFRYPVTMVAPNVWKPKMGLNNDKDYSRTRACELFPAYAQSFARKKDNNRAEAALIAYYGFRQLSTETK